MILTKSQIDNITKNIIIDYIKSKKIVNTSYEDIVKRIPNEYLEDPTIKDEINANPYEENNLVDLIMVTACRNFIKDVEGIKGRHCINKDFTIDFRKKVEACITEAGNVFVSTNVNYKNNKGISEQ